jgi:hypothetical protein
MRKVRILVAAAIAAVPLALVTASPAAACKQHPCPGVCKLNSPVYVEGGEVYLFDRDLVECYY